MTDIGDGTSGPGRPGSVSPQHPLMRVARDRRERIDEALPEGMGKALTAVSFELGELRRIAMESTTTHGRALVPADFRALADATRLLTQALELHAGTLDHREALPPDETRP